MISEPIRPGFMGSEEFCSYVPQNSVPNADHSGIIQIIKNAKVNFTL